MIWFTLYHWYKTKYINKYEVLESCDLYSIHYVLSIIVCVSVFKHPYREDLECISGKQALGSVMLAIPGCLLPWQKVIGTSPLLSSKSQRSLPKMIINLLLLLVYTHHQGSQLSSSRSQTKNCSLSVWCYRFSVQRKFEKEDSTGIDHYIHPRQLFGLVWGQQGLTSSISPKQPWGKNPTLSFKGRQMWV